MPQINVETEIPVPWGHVAAKVWGNEKDPFVLVVHGIMDNAGSFDRLIPLLPPNFYYVCIDLPGHGKSSHWPPYLPIYSINNILVYQLVLKHFKKEKCILLAHSWGGQIGFLFAQLYPEVVEKLIMLDTLHLFPVHIGQFKNTLKDKFEYCLNLEAKLKNGTPPTYTYEEALEKLMSSRHHGSLNPEAAKALLQRSIKETADGRFSFTIDQRMKSFINPIHDFRYIMETIKKFPVQCNVLIILGRDSELQRIYMKPIINQFRKSKKFKIVNVDGHHDVHNNNPEIVAPYINQFLLRKKAKL